MLVNRYENKHRLIIVHLRSLFDLPSLTRDFQRSSISRNQVNNTTEALRNLDHAVEHWNEVFVFLVAEKLDTEM